MSIWAIIATGTSLNDAEIESVRQLRSEGKIEGVIAVNNAALDKAPWADALVAHDSVWWMAYPESMDFKGRKFSKHRFAGTEKAPCPLKSCNSGLLAMFVARDVFKADRIMLFGFDFYGTHYFGKHTARVGYQELRNTTPERFSVHVKQFDSFSSGNSPYLGIDTIHPCQCFSHVHPCVKAIDLIKAKKSIGEFIADITKS